MEKLLKVKLSMKSISIGIVIFYVLSLIPLFLLGSYNYPSADDFSSAAAGFTAWKETGSFLAVMKAAAEYTVRLYLTWTGDFVTTFFTILQPGIFGDKGYFIVPFLSIGALTLGAYYFGSVILRDVLKMDKSQYVIITTLYLIVSIQRMVSGVEAFYWYSGVSNYIFPFALELLLFGFLIRLCLADDNRNRRKYLLLSTLFEILLGFCTYLAALQVFIINLGIVVILLLFRQTVKLKRYILPVSAFVISFLFNVLAPGNSVRMQGEQGFSAIKSILISFYYCLQYTMERWLDWSLIAVLLLLIPIMWSAVRKSCYTFKLPLIVTAGSYALLSAMFTPALFGSGSVDAGRLQNQIFLVFVLLLFINEYYLIGWIYNHLSGERVHLTDRKNNLSEEMFLSGNRLWYFSFIVVFIAFGTVLTSIPESRHFTTASALESLVSGEASAYGNEIDSRRKQLADKTQKTVELNPLSAKPLLLFFSDAKAAPEDWENIAMCRYYEKDSIVVKSVKSVKSNSKA